MNQGQTTILKLPGVVCFGLVFSYCLRWSEVRDLKQAKEHFHSVVEIEFVLG